MPRWPELGLSIQLEICSYLTSQDKNCSFNIFLKPVCLIHIHKLSYEEPLTRNFTWNGTHLLLTYQSLLTPHSTITKSLRAVHRPSVFWERAEMKPEYEVHLFPFSLPCTTSVPTGSYTTKNLLWDPINSASQSQNHQCYRKRTPQKEESFIPSPGDQSMPTLPLRCT